MPFQPVESQRLYERVAKQIGDLIRAGEYTAGDRLPAERDLAKKLGVSRPVVREAMIALEVAELVEVRVGSGAYVRDQAPAEPVLNAGESPSDILNARMLIEGETAALAAKVAADIDIDVISVQVEIMKREHDAGRPWHVADLDFHTAVARATGNAVLPGIVERLWQMQHGAVFALLSERVNLAENWTATLEGHQAVLSALRARNGKAARAAMRAHLAQVLEAMTREL